MEPWHLDDQATIYHGDCLEVLQQLPDASVDSVVTDPPYGLEFMGKEWDRFDQDNGWRRRVKEESDDPNKDWGVFNRTASRSPHLFVAGSSFQLWCQEWAAECLRVLKPGGHLLAFGGTRTWHRLAVAIEDAGFEIRDSIAWMYGSGFPKSLDVSKAIDKAAGAERPVVGPYREARRKPNGSRSHHSVGLGDRVGAEMFETAPATPDAARWQGWGTALKPAHEPVVVARKPLTGTVAANVLEHGTGALNIDGCRIGTAGATKRASQESRKTSAGWTTGHDIVAVQAGRWPANVVLDEDQAAALDRQSGQVASGGGANGKMGGVFGNGKPNPNRAASLYNDTGGASRFFYVAKAPARERPKVDGVAHPTVKPLTLMRWLCRLVTPPGGVVLEPFAGSGTTIEAALMEGFRVVAIEREPDYLPLIAARLERVTQEPDDGQLTFDASA